MAAQRMTEEKTVFYKGRKVKTIEFAASCSRTLQGDLEIFDCTGKGRTYINGERVPLRVANRILREKHGPEIGTVSFAKPGARLGYQDWSIAGKGKWVNLA